MTDSHQALSSHPWSSRACYPTVARPNPLDGDGCQSTLKNDPRQAARGTRAAHLYGASPLPDGDLGEPSGNHGSRQVSPALNRTDDHETVPRRETRLPAPHRRARRGPSRQGVGVFVPIGLARDETGDPPGHPVLVDVRENRSIGPSQPCSILRASRLPHSTPCAATTPSATSHQSCQPGINPPQRGSSTSPLVPNDPSHRHP